MAKKLTKAQALELIRSDWSPFIEKYEDLLPTIDKMAQKQNKQELRLSDKGDENEI